MPEVWAEFGVESFSGETADSVTRSLKSWLVDMGSTLHSVDNVSWVVIDGKVQTTVFYKYFRR